MQLKNKNTIASQEKLKVTKKGRETFLSKFQARNPTNQSPNPEIEEIIMVMRCDDEYSVIQNFYFNAGLMEVYLPQMDMDGDDDERTDRQTAGRTDDEG